MGFMTLWICRQKVDLDLSIIYDVVARPVHSLRSQSITAKASVALAESHLTVGILNNSRIEGND